MPVQKKEQKNPKRKQSKRSEEKIKSKFHISKGLAYFWLKLKKSLNKKRGK